MGKRTIIMMGYVIGSIFILIIGGGLVFLNTSPQFGGKTTVVQQEKYKRSPNFKDGKFVNDKEIHLSMSFREGLETAKNYFKPVQNTIPVEKLKVDLIDSVEIVNYSEKEARLFWFGHSSFLVQIQGMNVIIDPMLGDVPAPHPFLGSSRFSEKLPIAIERIPVVDVVVISHDHYDHLDYKTIVKLKDKVKAFYTPLGVGKHLIAWGVDADRIYELDWWQSDVYNNLTLRCTPSQHFSGRGLTDGASTLWSSWVIESENEKLFFSGDGGYGEHFKEIGQKYGPFDLALIECGQYNKKWSDIHMFPEQTVQAAIDTRSRVLMPVHWGAFKLAEHTWTDPIERVLAKSNALGMTVTTPRIGEAIVINDEMDYPQSKWWKEN